MKSLKVLSIALCGFALLTGCNKSVAVTGISLAPETLTLNVGESSNLNAAVQPDEATNKNLIWSSSDTGVATVDANGKVTAVKAGSAVITVKSEDGGKTATCNITVVVLVTGITLDKTELDMKVGDAVTLKATVLPENATDKSVSWLSGDPEVVSVDDAGKVTALKEGVAAIYAMPAHNITYTATCTVTVTIPTPVI